MLFSATLIAVGHFPELLLDRGLLASRYEPLALGHILLNRILENLTIPAFSVGTLHQIQKYPRSLKLNP